MARLLIAYGADVNATVHDQEDPDGSSVLLVAVSRGHTEVVKILIESGADVNVEDGKGWSALDGATARDVERSTRREPKEICEVEIAPGAQTEACKSKGEQL
jgi:ankyrin repeat protein